MVGMGYINMIAIQLTNEELEQLKEILSKTYEQAKDNWDFSKVQSAKSLMKKLDAAIKNE